MLIASIKEEYSFPPTSQTAPVPNFISEGVLGGASIVTVEDDAEEPVCVLAPEDAPLTHTILLPDTLPVNSVLESFVILFAPETEPEAAAKAAPRR